MSKNETKPLPKVGDQVQVEFETTMDELTAEVIAVYDGGRIELLFAGVLAVDASQFEDWEDNDTSKKTYWNLML